MIEIDRSLDADQVVRVLDRLAIARGGAPAFVRFDNGPEFVAHAVADWCRFTGTESVFIDPSSPWQNAWIESFNGRLRDELLNGRQWDSLIEARVIIEDCRIDYNINGPHAAHGDLPPPGGPSTNPSRKATGPTIGSPSDRNRPSFTQPTPHDELERRIDSLAARCLYFFGWPEVGKTDPPVQKTKITPIHTRPDRQSSAPQGAIRS